jgi:N6-L-threonylcarbamoyladenine synthase
VALTLADRVSRAMEMFRAAQPETAAPVLVVAGGVAANAALRATLERVTHEHGFTLKVPPLPLCTDNAAMIAWAGAERLALGMTDQLDAETRARWPLDSVSAALVGHGRLGAKA